MADESIFNKIKEVFGTLTNNYNVLEEQIDINLQMEFFDQSRKVKKELSPDTKISNGNDLFSPNLSIDEKKLLLSRMASVEDIEVFRIIERFIAEGEKELHEWAILAGQESRMLIQSRLLDENQVFISTGLGGKGNKLRYFVVLFSNDGTEFTELQNRMLRSEFETTLHKYTVDIEEVQIYKNYASLLTMIPMDISIKDIFKEAIREANQFGNFLKDNFIITNVKQLSHQDITEFLNKHLGSDVLSMDEDESD